MSWLVLQPRHLGATRLIGSVRYVYVCRERIGPPSNGALRRRGKCLPLWAIATACRAFLLTRHGRPNSTQTFMAFRSPAYLASGQAKSEVVCHPGMAVLDCFSGEEGLLL